MAIAVRSTSTLTLTGFQDSSASPGAQISSPVGLAIGDYLVVGVFFAQDLGNSAVVVPSGFTQLTANGTSSNRMFVTYGLAIANSTVLSSVASGVYLRASGTATRIVAIAAALTGVGSFSTATTLNYTNAASSAVTFNQPTTGDTKFYLVVTNSSSPSTSPAHTSVGGTKIIQAMSPSATGATYSDSQISLMMGGTGASYAASVANGGSVGFSFTLPVANVAPTAAFTFSTSGLLITTDGTTSTSSNGTIVSYDWDWGDATTHSSGSTSSHTYSTVGTYTTILTVTDNGGLTNTSKTTQSFSVSTARPTVVGTPTTAVQTVITAKSLTINKPAGVASGDWLIAALRAQDSNATVDWTLSGWIRVGPAFVASSVAGRLGGFFAKYIPTASAETATNYTFTWVGGGGRAVGTIVRVQGANSSTLSTVNSPYLSTSITLGTRQIPYSVSDSNGLTLAFAANEQTSPNASDSATHTSSYGLVQSVFSTTGTAVSRTTLEVYQMNQDAGSTTQFDVTWAAVSSPNIQSIVLRALPGGNIAPTAGFSSSAAALTVSVISTATDPDGTIASTDWNWGDATLHDTTTSASHTYASAGTYVLTQTVTDNSGASSTFSATITVSLTALPVPHFGAGDSTSATTAAASTLSSTKPVNVANGDLLVAYVYGQNVNATVSSVPAGWTLAASFAQRPGGGIYTKPIPTASAETATSYSWTLSASGGRILIDIFRVTGADLSTPIDISGTSATEVGSISAFVNTSVTTNYGYSLLLGFNYWNNSTTAVSTMTAPAGMTAGDQLVSPTTGNTSGTLVSYQSVSSPGATGTRTVTYAPAAVNGAGLMVAIKSATPNPIARYTYTSISTTISVDGSTSAGIAAATIASYDWDWGDATLHGTAAVTTHNYATLGIYTVLLTVTDSNGLVGTTSKTVTLTNTGYVGIWRDSNGINHPGALYYWDGTAQHPFSATLTNIFQPVTVTQFLSAAHSPWFAAHRGFSLSYPEETLYAYRSATDWHIKAIEISVNYSADGTPWCFHDATTTRTTGVTGTIASMTDAQISILNNIGSTATNNSGQPARPVAKLVDVLNYYYNTHVIIIEDKTYTHTTAMLNLMDSYGVTGRPANDIFIWKVFSSASKTSFYDPATARGYHRWAYIFDSTMSTEFPALPASGKADIIGMDYQSSDATLSSAIAACVANGVMPTGHIITSITQRDRLIALGMKGLMVANKDVVPPWYNTWIN